MAASWWWSIPEGGPRARSRRANFASVSSLQFEKAEFDGPHRCAVCQAEIGAIWHLANVSRVCPSCRELLEAHVRTPVGLAGYAKALGAGALVGLLCSAAWAGLRSATGTDFGIAAIGVGWVVGMAMRRAAGRGSRGLQFASVAAVYTSIVLSYVPTFAAGIVEQGVTTSPVRAWLLSIPLSFALPYFVWENVGSALIWYLIVGIGIHTAWGKLTPKQIEFSGPVSR